ncbi:MAG: hypothetical protein JWO38_1036 [Gemmataceae bacterium]|nr:hypothetical protein [Gemmataceae bacterium]
MKQLEAPAFDDREKASADLDTYGPSAVAAVQEGIKTMSSSEVERRLKEFLTRHAGERTSPVVLRGVRGVAVLEAIGTPDARKLLVKLARSSPGDAIGADAASALTRLEKRGSGK